MTRLRTYLLALLIPILAACGQAPPTTPGTGPQSLGLTAAGGTLEATGDDGSRITIVFPAGAVHLPVDVKLTPLPAAGGALARFRVDPDLELELPAAVTLTLPEGSNASAMAVLAFEADAVPIFVPTTVAGSSLRADLRLFRLPALPVPTAAVAPLQGDEGAIAAVEAGCAARLDALRWSYDALMASNSFEAALRVLNVGGATASTCGDFEAFNDFVASLPEPACARYADLVLIAEVMAADDYDRFNELVQPVMAWEGAMQVIGVECEEAPSSAAVVEAKYDQFLTFYRGRLAAAFAAEFERLLNEARKTYRLQGHAALLGLSEAQAVVERDVLHEVMDQLRERGYDACVAGADHYYLSTSLFGVFTGERPRIGPLAPLNAAASAGLVPLGGHARFDDDDIIADLQACASTLIVEVWADADVPVEVTGSRRELRPADTAGERNDRAATVTPVDGFVVLRGPIEPFRCGFQRRIESQELVVTFAGREVHRVPTLAGHPEIDVAAALTASGRSRDGVNTVDLVVRRESPACQGFYGGSQDLFTVTLTTDPAPRLSGASVAPATLTASDEFATFTFTVPWSDPGQNLRRLVVAYELAGVRSTDTVELPSPDPDHATGFAGADGTGTYRQDLRVFCSEVGKSPIHVTFTLEDAFGQRSAPRTVTLPVDYGGCASASSVASAAAAPSLESRAPAGRP